MKSFERILIINPFGIGDVLFSMTLVDALRKAFPDSVIGFLCNERTHRLARMNPDLNSIHVFNRDLLRRLWALHPWLAIRKVISLLNEIRKERFDTVFDVSLGREFNFAAMCLGIRNRIGFDYKGRGFFLTHKKKIRGFEGRSVAEFHLDLLRIFGITADVHHSVPSLRIPLSGVERAADILKAKGIDEGDSILAVAPGGGRSWGENAIFKQWDPEHFASTVRQLTVDKRFKVIFLGDPTERELIERTQALLGGTSARICHEPLEVTAALLARSRLLICNDGGLLHLANVLGAKTVSVFGPVDEEVYGPIRLEIPHRVVTQDVFCRPCYRQFNFPPCPYERRCLKEVTPEIVVEAAGQIA